MGENRLDFDMSRRRRLGLVSGKGNLPVLALDVTPLQSSYFRIPHPCEAPNGQIRKNVVLGFRKHQGHVGRGENLGILRRDLGGIHALQRVLAAESLFHAEGKELSQDAPIIVLADLLHLLARKPSVDAARCDLRRVFLPEILCERMQAAFEVQQVAVAAVLGFLVGQKLFHRLFNRDGFCRVLKV